MSTLHKVVVKFLQPIMYYEDLPNLNDFLPYIDENTAKHTIIMTFGAGSITNFSFVIADYLKERGK